MPPLRPRSPKTSRPRLISSAPRPRLFAVLQSLSDTPCLWIHGPPGSGKTSLVHSWANQCNGRVLWYTLDASDADPTAFIENLWHAVTGQASSPLCTAAPPAPTFTSDICTASLRTFFRQCFSPLEEDLTIVLDNYNEVPSEAPLAAVIANAVREAPSCVRFIVVSRTRPHGLMVDLEIKNLLSRVGWDQLRLDESETRSICRSHGLHDPHRFSESLSRCKGWAAPIVLYAHQCRPGQTREDTESRWRSALGDYLEGIQDEALDDPLRVAVLRSALLPAINPATVGVLTGCEALPDWLRRQAYEENLFFPDDQRPGRYVFHPLLQDHLVSEALALFGEEYCCAFRRRAAALLEQLGDPLGAFEVSLIHQDWEACTRALWQLAPRMLDAGQSRAVAHLIQQIPAISLDSHPGLSLWLGRALVQHAPEKSHSSIDNAWRRYTADGDTKGQAQVAFAVVEAQCMSFGRWCDLRPWLTYIAETSDANLAFLPDQARFRWHSVLAASWTVVDPTASVVSSELDKSFKYSRVPCSINDRLVAAAAAGRASVLRGDLETAAALINNVSPSEADLNAYPLAGAFFLAQVGLQDMLAGHFVRASQRLDQAVSLARKGDHRGMLLRALCYRSAAAYLLRDKGAAIRTLRALREHVATEPPTVKAALCLLEAWHEQAFGVSVRTAGSLSDVARDWSACGSPTFALILSVISAGLLAERGAPEAARACLHAAQSVTPAAANTPFTAMRHALDCRIAQLTNDHVGAVAACKAFAASTTHSAIAVPWLSFLTPPTLSEVIGFGLTNHLIPLPTARELIQRLNLVAPDGKPELWPWKLRITTFGGLRIWLDGTPIAFGRKVPRKPIAVLKVLICMGGKDIPLTRLADSVWPDKTGDAATRAAITALHRLRRILQFHDAIVLEAGLLSLDTSRVWVDALVFRNITDMEVAKRVYRGEFLPEDSDEVWSLEPRRRFRQQYERLLEAAPSNKD